MSHSNNQLNYAKYIDHTLLKMDAKESEIKKVCDEAKANHFFSVCVNSGYVPFVAQELQGSDVKTCCVVGFPLGACLTSVKAFEAQKAIEAGANEIDMVINVGFLKSGKKAEVKEDIRAVQVACGDVLLKVILETCLLTKEEIVEVSLMCKELKVDFVKTSTGFSSGGATVDDVRLMRQTVGDQIGVKASGGVRSIETAQAMIEAGATRLGTSSGVAIVNGEHSNSAY